MTLGGGRGHGTVSIAVIVLATATGLGASEPVLVVAAAGVLSALLAGLAGATALLGVVVITCGISFNFLAEGGFGPLKALGGSNIDGLRLVLVLGGFAVLSLREPRVLTGITRVWPYLLFLGIAAASILWSPDPGGGFRLLCKLTYPVAAFLLCTRVMRTHGDHPLVTLVLAAVLVATVFNLAVVMAGASPFQGDGYEARYRGALHPNSIGLFCAAAGLMLYAFWSDRSRSRYLVMLLVALAQLFATGSRSAVLAGGAGFLAFDLLGRRWLRALVLISVGLAAWTLIPTLGERTMAGGDDGGILVAGASSVNLSGRLILWADMWTALIGDGQFTGRGLGATEAFFTNRYSASLGSHNGYLALIADTGWVGFGLVVGFFVMMLIGLLHRAAHQRNGPAHSRMAIAMVVTYLMAAFVENTFVGYASPTSLVWVALALGLHPEPIRADALGTPGRAHREPAPPLTSHA